LAGRNIGLFALIGTTMASIFSTGTVVSSPSEFYRQGTGYCWVFFDTFHFPFLAYGDHEIPESAIAPSQKGA
jgi:Na+/proline symporter